MTDIYSLIINSTEDIDKNIISFKKELSNVKTGLVISPLYSIVPPIKDDFSNDYNEITEKVLKFIDELKNELSSNLSLVLSYPIIKNNRIIILKNLITKGYVETSTDKITYFSINNQRFALSEDNYKKDFKINKTEEVAFHIILASRPFYLDFQTVIKRKLKTSKNTFYISSLSCYDGIVFPGLNYPDNNINNFEYKEGIFKLENSFNNDKIDKQKIIKNTIVFALKSYVLNNGFQSVHLGVSGGIDSALTTALCLELVKQDKLNYKGFLLPSSFSSSGSLKDSIKMLNNMDLSYLEVEIENLRLEYNKLFGNNFGELNLVTQQNIQARIRANILMGYANNFNSLLIATGNKSEILTGYCTMYGDSCGALAPIGDLFKNEVYALAKYINKENGSNLIPKAILSKAPSAELSEGQKDSDNLPEYNKLDLILNDYCLKGKQKSEISRAKDISDQDIDNAIKLYKNSAYKRKQLPFLICIKKETLTNQLNNF